MLSETRVMIFGQIFIFNSKLITNSITFSTDFSVIWFFISEILLKIYQKLLETHSVYLSEKSLWIHRKLWQKTAFHIISVIHIFFAFLSSFMSFNKSKNVFSFDTIFWIAILSQYISAIEAKPKTFLSLNVFGFYFLDSNPI